MKQAILWVLDALRDIPNEVIKNCRRKVGILPFERYSKGDAHVQKAADHFADLYGKLSRQSSFNLRRRLYVSSILRANRGD